MFDAQSLSELHSRIPSEEHRDLSRATIVSVVVTPDNKIVLVQPKSAKSNGWIFPQGEFVATQTRLEAALEVAKRELQYSAEMFDLNKARFIGKGAESLSTGKQYYVVTLPLSHWVAPSLNHENDKWCTVGGPGELTKKVGGCSLVKKKLIRVALEVAIKKGVLYSQRWHTSHASFLLQHL